MSGDKWGMEMGGIPEEPAAICRKLIMLKWRIQRDKFMSVLIKEE